MTNHETAYLRHMRTKRRRTEIRKFKHTVIMPPPRLFTLPFLSGGLFAYFLTVSHLENTIQKTQLYIYQTNRVSKFTKPPIIFELKDGIQGRGISATLATGISGHLYFRHILTNYACLHPPPVGTNLTIILGLKSVQSQSVGQLNQGFQHH